MIAKFKYSNECVFFFCSFGCCSSCCFAIVLVAVFKVKTGTSAHVVYFPISFYIIFVSLLSVRRPIWEFEHRREHVNRKKNSTRTNGEIETHTKKLNPMTERRGEKTHKTSSCFSFLHFWLLSIPNLSTHRMVCNYAHLLSLSTSKRRIEFNLFGLILLDVLAFEDWIFLVGIVVGVIEWII